MKHVSRAWAAPVSLLGLTLALVLSLIARTRWQVVAGVIEVAPRDGCHAFGTRCLKKLPFDAITLGHVVIGSSTSCLRSLRAHEHAHVRQYERWGVCLLIAYPAASVWMLARGRRPYLDNPFEVQARAAERR
ncbi:hypothetical protein [Aquabacterium parvum]|jgi:hypothetical protein|uniref:hypothetical protein n=1 Tax=Aquabacterium parvum TaxID=70584 RepID=UPI000718BD54|nr:hypothetical protein [Aquabacterium parvum]MBU0918327.1 hypothetical protein [Gammaproteobacteria bacterium]